MLTSVGILDAAPEFRGRRFAGECGEFKGNVGRPWHFCREIVVQYNDWARSSFFLTQASPLSNFRVTPCLECNIRKQWYPKNLSAYCM